MSLVVVRCPACLGASRVELDALGQTVACPRCQVPFIAAEEVVPVVKPVSRPTSAAAPVAPPRRRPRPRSLEDLESLPPDTSPGTPQVPDPEHDPHLPHVAGLPVSVLVGLSLLPFAIPVFWWAAPFITGQEAALSLAVPISLAFAASTLCLGVVYTIDWTAATRIKGVLMLVGLAYLAAAGLYFLKKDLIGRIQRFGGQEIAWRPVQLDGGKAEVRMPGEAYPVENQPLPNLVKMNSGKEAKYESEIADVYRYLATSGPVDKGQAKPDAAWYDAVGAQLATTGKIISQSDVKPADDIAGRQWTIQVDSNTVRIVQVYLIDERVYYLSVEGRNITTDIDDEYAYPFFNSFGIKKTEKQKAKDKNKPRGKGKDDAKDND